MTAARKREKNDGSPAVAAPIELGQPVPSATEALVDRFLAWPLPTSVRSDPCVTMDYPHPRSGTNLLTADEARQMIEYLLPTCSPPAAASRMKEALEAIAGFGEVNLSGEWEPSLRDIIRSCVDAARAALRAQS